MSQIKGMRFIEDYRGKFRGSDIWVLGCDPNLDLYPDDFFDDKISITLNWACIAFPNSTYFTGDSVPSHRTPGFPGCLKKYIIPTSGKKGRKPLPWDVCGLDPIYMRSLTRKDAREQTKADFERMAEQAFGSGPFESAIGMTSACMGTQEAAVLGAKRIILVGCSMTMGDAQKRGMSEFYAGETWHPSAEYRAGQHKHQIRTRQSIARFAEIFKGYGVEVVRHRFDEEEGNFVFQGIKSEREDLWDIGYGGGKA